MGQKPFLQTLGFLVPLANDFRVGLGRGQAHGAKAKCCVHAKVLWMGLIAFLFQDVTDLNVTIWSWLVSCGTFYDFVFKIFIFNVAM